MSSKKSLQSIQFKNDGWNEIPIVRDYKDSARITEEIMGQICHARNIQHVARFCDEFRRGARIYHQVAVNQVYRRALAQDAVTRLGSGAEKRRVS